VVVVSKQLGRAGGFTCSLVVDMVLIGTYARGEIGVFWLDLMTEDIFTGMVDGAGGFVPLTR